MDALIVFVKNPVLGKVKTRLASKIGAENALKVYSALILHTQQILTTIPADIRIYYSEHIDTLPGWRASRCSTHVQRGVDLGERLHDAFEATFDAGYHRAIVIGSDCLELTTEHLTTGFHYLTTADVVIGPTFDGGYYLLGLNRFYPHFFAQKSWSTPKVYAQTIADIESKGLTWQTLATLNDIDTYEDLLTSSLNGIWNNTH